MTQQEVLAIARDVQRRCVEVLAQKRAFSYTFVTRRELLVLRDQQYVHTGGLSVPRPYMNGVLLLTVDHELP